MSAQDTFNIARTPLRQGINPVELINSSGGIIPPYAAMKLNGSLTGTRRQVIQPDEDSLSASFVVINGALSVPIDAPFEVSSYSEFIVQVNDTPDVDDDIGTVSGQWYMDTNGTGFKARGMLAAGGLAYAGNFRGGAFRTSIQNRSVVANTFITNSLKTITGSLQPLTDPIPGSRFNAGENTVISLSAPNNAGVASVIWNDIGVTGDVGGYILSYCNIYIEFAYDNDPASISDGYMVGSFQAPFNGAGSVTIADSVVSGMSVTIDDFPEDKNEITHFRLVATEITNYGGSETIYGSFDALTFSGIAVTVA